MDFEPFEFLLVDERALRFRVLGRVCSGCGAGAGDVCGCDGGGDGDREPLDELADDMASRAVGEID